MYKESKKMKGTHFSTVLSFLFDMDPRSTTIFHVAPKQLESTKVKGTLTGDDDAGQEAKLRQVREQGVKVSSLVRATISSDLVSCSH